MLENQSKFSACQAEASIWGVLAALGGLTHGIGEILQGNTAPKSIVVNSWAKGPIATNLGGEPGMTIVPNFLLTGILCVILSIVIIVWSLWFMQRKYGGRVQILLFVALLLVGGGFAPPIMGILSGWAGTGINSPPTFWRTRFSPKTQSSLAQGWPWFFAVCSLNTVVLVFGSVIAVYLLGYNNPDFFSNLFLITFALMPITIIMGFVHDVYYSKPIPAANDYIT